MTVYRSPAALAEAALAASRADHTVVFVRERSVANIRFANSTVTTDGSTTDRELSVLAFHESPAGTGVGAVSATGDPDVDRLVGAALDAAERAQPATDAMPLLGGSGVPPADWDAPAASTTIGVFDGVIDPLRAGFGSDTTLFGYAEHAVTTTWLASSTGLRLRFTEPVGSIEINGKRAGSSAWAGAGTDDFRDIDAAALLTEIDRRLSWGRRRIELPAGRYDTVLPPSTVADLMIPLLWAMDGRAAREGRSAFSIAGARPGDRSTSLPLSLRSDPTYPGLGTAPVLAASAGSDLVSVFDNGLALEPIRWIDDGVVDTLGMSRATAREFDAPVAVGADNLILESDAQESVDSLIAGVERGLLLTTLWYIRDVDPTSLLLTGLTRDGVYLIEDGAVTAEVNNFRFNESPLSVLRRADGVGATKRTLPREWKDWFTRTAMPPLRVPGFLMSTRSQAS